MPSQLLANPNILAINTWREIAVTLIEQENGAVKGSPRSMRVIAFGQTGIRKRLQHNPHNTFVPEMRAS